MTLNSLLFPEGITEPITLNISLEKFLKLADNITTEISDGGNSQQKGRKHIIAITHFLHSHEFLDDSEKNNILMNLVLNDFNIPECVFLLLEKLLSHGYFTDYQEKLPDTSGHALSYDYALDIYTRLAEDLGKTELGKFENTIIKTELEQETLEVFSILMSESYETNTESATTLDDYLNFLFRAGFLNKAELIEAISSDDIEWTLVHVISVKLIKTGVIINPGLLGFFHQIHDRSITKVQNKTQNNLDNIFKNADGLESAFDYLYAEAELILNECEKLNHTGRHAFLQGRTLSKPDNIEYILSFLGSKLKEKRYITLQGIMNPDALLGKVLPPIEQAMGELIPLSQDSIEQITAFHKIDKNHSVFYILQYLYKQGFFIDQPETMSLISGFLIRYNILFQSVARSEIETVQAKYLQIIGPRKALPYYGNELEKNELLEMTYSNAYQLIEWIRDNTLDKIQHDFLDEFLDFLITQLSGDCTYEELFNEEPKELYDIENNLDKAYGIILLLFCDFLDDNFDLMEECYILLKRYSQNRNFTNTIEEIFTPYRVGNSKQ